MNLNMIQTEIETEISLLSKSKNCEPRIKQTHRKPEEPLEFKLTQPKELF